MTWQLLRSIFQWFFLIQPGKTVNKPQTFACINLPSFFFSSDLKIPSNPYIGLCRDQLCNACKIQLRKLFGDQQLCPERTTSVTMPSSSWDCKHAGRNKRTKTAGNTPAVAWQQQLLLPHFQQRLPSSAVAASSSHQHRRRHHHGIASTQAETSARKRPATHLRLLGSRSCSFACLRICRDELRDGFYYVSLACFKRFGGGLGIKSLKTAINSSYAFW